MARSSKTTALSIDAGERLTIDVAKRYFLADDDPRIPRLPWFSSDEDRRRLAEHLGGQRPSDLRGLTRWMAGAGYTTPEVRAVHRTIAALPEINPEVVALLADSLDSVHAEAAERRAAVASVKAQRVEGQGAVR